MPVDTGERIRPDIHATININEEVEGTTRLIPCNTSVSQLGLHWSTGYTGELSAHCPAGVFTLQQLSLLAVVQNISSATFTLLVPPCGAHHVAAVLQAGNSGKSATLALRRNVLPRPWCGLLVLILMPCQHSK